MWKWSRPSFRCWPRICTEGLKITAGSFGIPGVCTRPYDSEGELQMTTMMCHCSQWMEVSCSLAQPPSSWLASSVVCLQTCSRLTTSILFTPAARSAHYYCLPISAVVCPYFAAMVNTGRIKLLYIIQGLSWIFSILPCKLFFFKGSGAWYQQGINACGGVEWRFHLGNFISGEGYMGSPRPYSGD